jgi:hypothetical protein
VPPTDGSLLCALGIACADPEPVDAALAARFEHRPVAVGPLPVAARSTVEREPAIGFPDRDAGSASARREVQLLFERLGAAAERRDVAEARSVGMDYLQTGSAKAWQAGYRTPPGAGTAVDVPLAEEAIERTAPAVAAPAPAQAVRL